MQDHRMFALIGGNRAIAHVEIGHAESWHRPECDRQSFLIDGEAWGTDRSISPAFDEEASLWRRTEYHRSGAWMRAWKSEAAASGAQVKCDIARNVREMSKRRGIADRAVDIGENDRLAGVAIHCGKDLGRLALSVGFPATVGLPALDEIVRDARSVQLFAQAVPEMPVVRCEPAADNELIGHGIP